MRTTIRCPFRWEPPSIWAALHYNLHFVARRGPYPRHPGGLPHRGGAVRAVRHQRLRRLRRGRRFPAAGSPGLQPVRHLHDVAMQVVGVGFTWASFRTPARPPSTPPPTCSTPLWRSCLSAPGTAESLTAPSAPQFEKLPLQMAPEREFSLSKKSFQQS